MPRTTVVEFRDRPDRARYVVSEFDDLLHGRVLDVGCDRKLIHELRPDLDYIGIDVGGTPDLTVDLDATERLPFDDRSFDCVICTDVLEHLDKLHRVFDEIVRVTKPGGHLVISLPNCWNNLRGRIRRGTGTPRHYGLPATPPEDRHRWFMNTDDILAFMDAQTERAPVRIARTLVNEHRGSLRRLARLLYPAKRRYQNRYAHTVWTVLQKVGDASTPA